MSPDELEALSKNLNIQEQSEVHTEKQPNEKEIQAAAAQMGVTPDEKPPEGLAQAADVVNTEVE